MPIKKRSLYQPKNETVKLTAKAIRTMSPSSSDYFVKDAEVPKLQLKVTPKGAKSFLIRYRNRDGRERKYKIGNFPDLTAAAARIEATKLAAEIAKGDDPAQNKKDRRHGTTFAEYAAQFMAEHAELHLRPTTVRSYYQLLNSRLLPSIGQRSLRSVTSDDVQSLKQIMRETPYQANRAIGLVRTIYNYAESQGDVPPGINPTKRIGLFKEKKKERIIKPGEFEAIGTAIQNLKKEKPHISPSLNAIMFLFATGRRKSEILRLKWEDVDLERRTLCFTQTKTEALTQPIPIPILPLLAEMEASKSSNWLFPSPTTTGPLTDIKKTWANVKMRAGISDLRLHDIRHTVLTDVSAKSDIQTAASVAGHKSVRSTMRYLHGRSDRIRDTQDQVAAETFQSLFGDSE